MSTRMYLRNYSRCQVILPGEIGTTRCLAFRISNAAMYDEDDDRHMTYELLLLWMHLSGPHQGRLKAMDGTTDKPLKVVTNCVENLADFLFPPERSLTHARKTRSATCACVAAPGLIFNYTEDFDRIHCFSGNGLHLHKATVTRSSCLRTWLCTGYFNNTVVKGSTRTIRFSILL